jgi:hypothetical protein
MAPRFNQGEFVYVPASTYLYKFGDRTCDVFLEQRKTNKPMYLMFLKSNDHNSSYCELFFEGSVWNVSIDNIYDYKEESNG